MRLSIDKNNLRINPVLVKEFKVKMRGWRAPILIGVYNLVLSLLAIFITKITMNNYSGRVDASSIFATYAFLVVMQFGLITLISPALTAGAISGERERQTLDILMSTTLKHGSIITGKLFACLSHIILLVLSSIPVFSIIFLYGSIGVVELLQVFLFYIIMAITFGSIGIFFSTFIKKSTAANVLTYAVVVFLFLGTLLISIFYVQLVITPSLPQGTQYTDNFFLMYINPGAALASLLATQFGQGMGSVFPGLYLSGKQSGLQLWEINAIINLVISFILLYISTIKLNPVKTDDSRFGFIKRALKIVRK